MYLAYTLDGRLYQIGGKATDLPPYDKCVAKFFWQEVDNSPALASGYENAGTIGPDGIFTLTETGDTFLLVDPLQATKISRPDWGKFADLLVHRLYLIAALGSRYSAMLTRLRALQAALTQWEGAQDGLIRIWSLEPVTLSNEQKTQLNQDFLECNLPLKINDAGELLTENR